MDKGARRKLHGQAKSPDEIIKIIEGVTVDDLQRVADDLFTEDKMKLAVIGPYSDSSRFEALMKI